MTNIAPGASGGNFGETCAAALRSLALPPELSRLTVTATVSAPLNPFRTFWDLGYRRLIPIVPPAVEISERSSLARKLAAGRDDRGKAPGVRLTNGQWSGFADWQRHVATEADLDQWSAMGASVGLSDDGGLLLLDIDATDHATADQIERDATAAFGPAPMRVGAWPKRAMIYRTTAPLTFQAVTFAGANPTKPDRIEVLAGQKQMVVAGVHARTGRPYEWRRPIVPRDELTMVTPEQVDAFMAAQRAKLPRAELSKSSSASDRSAVNQAALAGDVPTIRKAVAALPNTRALFSGYDDMIRVGEAIHAATINDPEAGREIYHEWASRWEGGDYDAAITDARWDTFKAPHGLGASWLYDQADRHSGGAFSKAELWFEPDGDVAPLFPDRQSAPAAPKNNDMYDVFDIEDLLNRPDPKFLLDRHIPETSLGFLYGNPGTGKSFIALDWSMHIASGKPTWFGDPILSPDGACVIYLAGEGVSGLKSRVQAWQKRHGVSAAGGFKLLPYAVNFMNRDDIEKLLRTVRQKVDKPVALIVVDTVSRSIPGADENLQKEMSLFVDACGALQKAFLCTVLGLHHANKDGDMRGSGVLLGAGDFVFKLERRKGAPIGRLHCEKQKDGPDGWSDPYRLDVVDLGEGKSSLVPWRIDENIGPGVALTPDITNRVLAAIDAAWLEGRPWGRTYHAKDRMAARRMVDDFGFGMETAENILSVWFQDGRIAVETVSTKSKQKGLRVIGGAASGPAERTDCPLATSDMASEVLS